MIRHVARWVFVGWVCVICVLLLLEAPGGPAMGGQAPRVVRVMDWPVRLAHLPRFVAMDYLSREGYRAEWQYYQNPATFVAAFVSGQADVALLSANQAVNINERGGQVRLLTVAWGALDWVLVSTTKIKTLADITGKVVGISQPGAESEFLFTRMLVNHGIDPARVSYAAIGATPDRATALLAGRIDATWLGYDVAYKVLQNGNFQVLEGITVGHEFPDKMDLLWAAPLAFIKANPALVRSIVKNQILANRWAQNREAFLARMERSDVSAIRDVGRKGGEWSHDRYMKDHMFPVNGGLQIRSFANTLSIDLAAGVIKKIPEYRDTVAVEIQDDVLNEIGTAK